jgi:hypothetical protein
MAVRVSWPFGRDLPRAVRTANVDAQTKAELLLTPAPAYYMKTQIIES